MAAEYTDATSIVVDGQTTTLSTAGSVGDLPLSGTNPHTIEVAAGEQALDASLSFSDASTVTKTGDGLLAISGLSGKLAEVHVTDGTLYLDISENIFYNSEVKFGVAGSSASDVATLQLRDRNTTSITFELGGNALIEAGSGAVTSGDNAAAIVAIEAWGGKIVATGTNNIVDVRVNERGGFTYDVQGADGTLVLNKGMYRRTAADDGTGKILKSGAGLLTVNNGMQATNTLKIEGGSVAISGTSSLAGGLTMADGTSFINSGALTLGGTLALAGSSTIEMATGSTLTLNNLTIDVSNMTGVTTGDVTVYTLFSGAETVDLSALGLTGDNVTGMTGHGSWSFNSDGTISLTTASSVTWGDGALTWKVGEAFGEGTYVDGMVTEFTGEATVTLGGDVKPSVMTVTDAAKVSFDSADGYTITVDELTNQGQATFNVALTADTIIMGADSILEVNENASVEHYDVTSSGTAVDSAAGSIVVAAGKTFTIGDIDRSNNAQLWSVLRSGSGEGLVVIQGADTFDARNSYHYDEVNLISGRYVIEGAIAVNNWDGASYAMTTKVDSGSYLRVKGADGTFKDGVSFGAMTFMAKQTLQVAGELIVDNSFGIGYKDGGYGGHLQIMGGTMTANKVHLYESGELGTLSITDGGRLNLGDGGLEAREGATPIVTITEGTLGATEDWSSAVAMTLGNATVDTTVQVVGADGEAVKAGSDTATITLSGTISTTDTSKLTLTGKGTLALTGTEAVTLAGGLDTTEGGTLSVNSALTLGGTVKLGNAITMAAGGSLTLAANTTLDLTGLTANGNSYTLATGEGSLDLSSLANVAGLNIITGDDTPKSWAFNADGTISYTLAGLVTWSGGDMTWTSASKFDEDATVTTSSYVTFSGTSAVTMGENITVSSITIGDGAAVTLSSAEGAANTLTATKGISLGGTLTVQDDVLTTGTRVTAAGANASFIIDGVAVDYTSQLSAYTGAVTVKGTEGKLSLSAVPTYSALSVTDGATLDLTGADLTYNDGGTISVNDGTIGLNANTLKGTVSLSGNGTIAALGSGNNITHITQAAVSGKGDLTLDGTAQSLQVGGESIAHTGSAILKGKVGLGYWFSDYNKATAVLGNDGAVTLEEGSAVEMKMGSSIANTGDLNIKGELTVYIGSDVKNGGVVNVLGGTLNLETAIEANETGDALFSNGKLNIASGGVVNSKISALTLSSLAIDGGVLNLKSAITAKENFTLSIANSGQIKVSAADFAGWTALNTVDDSANGTRGLSYALVTGLSGTAPTLDDTHLVYVDGKACQLKLNDAKDAIVFDYSDGLYYVSTGEVAYDAIGSDVAGVALNGGTLSIDADDAVSLPVNVVKASSLNIGTDATLDASKISNAAGLALNLTGAGSYKLTDAGQLTGLSASAAGWTGTVSLNGMSVKALDLNTIGNAGSTIEFCGVTGYFSQATGAPVEYVADIKLVNTADDAAALTFNDGWGGDQRVFSGTVTGTGDVVRVNKGSDQTFSFTGDVSGWTGSFTHAGNELATDNTYLTFSGAAVEINADIAASADSLGTLSVTVDNASAVAVNGDISGTNTKVTYSGTGTKTISGANSYAGGTTISGGTVVATTNASLGTGLATVNSGTLELQSTVTQLAGGVSLAEGATLYLNGSKLEGTNITNGGVVKLGDASSICALSGGALVVEAGASAAASADVSLDSFTNGGTFDLGTHKLTLNGAVTDGGKVSAGTLSTAAATSFTSVEAGTLELGATLAATGEVSGVKTLTVSDAALLASTKTAALVTAGTYTLGEGLTVALGSDVLPAGPVSSEQVDVYTLVTSGAALADTSVDGWKEALESKLTLSIALVGEAEAQAESNSFEHKSVVYTLTSTNGSDIVLTTKYTGFIWETNDDTSTGEGDWNATDGDGFAGTAPGADDDVLFAGGGTNAEGEGTINVSGTVEVNSVTVNAADKSYTFSGTADDSLVMGDLDVQNGDVTLEGLNTTINGQLTADTLTNTGDLTIAGTQSSVTELAGGEGSVTVAADAVVLGTVSTGSFSASGTGTDETATGVTVTSLTADSVSADASTLEVTTLRDATSIAASNGAVLTVTGDTTMSSTGTDNVISATGDATVTLAAATNVNSVSASSGATLMADSVTMAAGETPAEVVADGGVVEIGTVSGVTGLSAANDGQVTVALADPTVALAIDVAAGGDADTAGISVTGSDLTVSSLTSGVSGKLTVTDGSLTVQTVDGAAVAAGGNVSAHAVDLSAVEEAGSSFTSITTEKITLNVAGLSSAGDAALLTVADALVAAPVVAPMPFAVLEPPAFSDSGLQIELTGIPMGADGLGAAKAEDATAALAFAEAFTQDSYTLIDCGTLVGGLQLTSPSLADVQQLFALTGKDAQFRLRTEGGRTSVVLTLTEADDREWTSNRPDWAGPSTNADLGIDLATGRPTLAVSSYDVFNTVQKVTMVSDYTIDLGADAAGNDIVMTSATDASRGLTVRELDGDGSLSLVGSGMGEDLVTLIQSTDRTLNGDLSATDITVQVESTAAGSGLTVSDLSLSAAEMVLLSNQAGSATLEADKTTLADGSMLTVENGAHFTTGQLNADGVGAGTISGIILVSGQGGNYSGSYKDANVVLLDGAQATLTPNSGLNLQANNAEVTLSYKGGNASMEHLSATGTAVTLENTDAQGSVSTLNVAPGSSLTGGTLSFGVNGAAIAAGKAQVITSGLSLNGTSVVATQVDKLASTTFDVSQGTEGLTLFTFADALAVDVSSVTLNGALFDRYFDKDSIRVENGEVKADLITDYYTSKLAVTENGTTGLQMLDAADLQVNPEGNATQYKDLAGIIASLKTSDAATADNLASAVAGSGVASLGMALAGDVDRQLKAIRNRTTTMGVDPSVVNEDMPYFNAWINAEGDHRTLDQDGTLAGYTLDSWGGTVGFDMDVNPSLTWGLAITAMYGDFSAESSDVVEGDVDTYYVSAFARAMSGAWVHTFVGTVGISKSELTRTVSHSVGSYTTDGEADGMSFGLLYEVGRTFALNEDATACWQPVFNVAYRHTEVDGYDESGSDAALRVGDQSLDTVTFGLGARMQAVVGENLYNRTSIFEARALAKFDAGDRESEMDTTLLSASTASGKVKSAELDAFGVELGAGLTVPVGMESGSIFLDGSVELRGSYTNINGTVGYRVNF